MAFFLEAFAKLYSLINLIFIQPALIYAMGLTLFGYYNWLFSIGSLIARLIPLGIIDSAFRTLPKTNKKKHYEIHKFVITQTLKSLLIFYILIAVAWVILEDRNKELGDELIIIAIISSSVLCVNMFQGISRQSGFFLNSYIILITQQIFFAGMLIYLFKNNYAEKSIYLVTFCLVISSTSVVALLYPNVILKLKGALINAKQSNKDIKYIYLFGKTNLLAGAASAIWEFSDKIIAGLQLPSLDNAKYQIISNISTMATTGLLSGFMVLFQYVIIKSKRRNGEAGFTLAKFLPFFILFFIAPTLIIIVELSKSLLLNKYHLSENHILELNILILAKVYLISTNPFIDSTVAKRGRRLSIYSYVLLFSSVLMITLTTTLSGNARHFVMIVTLIYIITSLILQLIYSQPHLRRTSTLLISTVYIIYSFSIYKLGEHTYYTIFTSFTLAILCILYLRKITK